MRVLVTGASGFLGREVCATLRERGHEVSALVRRPGSEPDGTTAVAGDLADAASVADAVTQARPDCVIHLAAEIASQRDANKIEEVNVRGTQRLIDACLAADPRPRIVFASTVVTGDPHGAQIDEETQLPVETAYGRSKQEGERLLRESGLDTVIVRPCHIYGAGGWYVEEFVKRLKQPGRFAVIGSGNNWWDMARVEDVASAVCDAAEKAQPGTLYHVCDDEPIRMYDFLALTADALGVGRPRRIPAGMAKLVGGSEAVLAVTRSARNSNAKIKRELGWSPRYPTAEVGVPDAIRRLESDRSETAQA
jgi:nucleoside-diphosphate-sugar epimerase